MAVGRSVGRSVGKIKNGTWTEIRGGGRSVGRSVGRWELSFQLIPVQAGRRED